MMVAAVVARDLAGGFKIPRSQPKRDSCAQALLERGHTRRDSRPPPRCPPPQCGQQFRPSDADCHTPLPCEVRKKKDTTARACCPSAPGAGGAHAGQRQHLLLDFFLVRRPTRSADDDPNGTPE